MNDGTERGTRGPLGALYAGYRAGQIDRRTFLARATAIGLGLPVALFILNSVHVDSALAAPAAQDTVPLDSVRPTTGTENQQRGAGGDLKILQWQAATQAKGAGIALRTIMRSILGWSPEQITEAETDLADEQLSAFVMSGGNPTPEPTNAPVGG